MRDEDKTKRELIDELQEMRRLVSKLRMSEAHVRPGDTHGDSNIFESGPDFIRDRKAETRSQENTDTIEALLDATRDMVYLIDSDGAIIAANHRCVESLGGSHHRLIGSSLFDLLPPKLAAEQREKLDEVIRSGSAVIYEDQHHERHFEHSLYPISGIEGVQRIAVYSKDVTDRKRAEEALHRLNRELGAVRNCNQALVRAVEEQALLADICRIICEEAGYRMAWVGYAENDAAKTIRPVAWSGAEDGYLEQAGFTWADTEQGREPAGTAIRSGETACIQDFAIDSQAAPWREGAVKRGYHSAIGLPLKDKMESVFGILCIYSTASNSFTEQEVRLLEELSGDLAFGVAVLRARIELERVEEALRESGTRVRRKLDAILSPETDVEELELSDIIDSEKIQKLMDQFYRLTNVGVGILDLHGAVLVGAGWQDICTKFHRVNPESCRLCVESDLELTRNVEIGTFKKYRCKNNMWDIATPIMLGDRHVGNIFLGQFFFDDEIPEYEIFRRQARKYGFNEEEYISALDKAPRWSHEKVDAAMSFYAVLASVIGNLSYSNIKLANALEERKRAEEALREREEFLSSIVENIPAMIFIKDAKDLRFVRFNKAGERLLGYGRDDLIGKTEYEFLPKEQADLLTKRDAEVIQSGQVYDAPEDPIDTKTGRRILHTTKIPILDKTGTPAYLLGISEDISERKRAEERLRESEERFRAVFENAAIGISVVDSEGNLLQVNRSLAEMLGYTEHELLKLTVFDLTHHDDVDVSRIKHEKMVRGETESYRFEKRYIRKNGEILWADVSVSPVRGFDGGHVATVGAIADITDRKQTEKELQRSNDLLGAIIEAAPTAIFGLDLDGKVQMVWNPAAENMLGWSAREVIGRSLPIEPGEGQEGFTSYRERICSGETLNGVEVTRHKRSGAPIDYSIYSSPLRNAEGRISGNVCVLVDMTDRKRAENAVRASEEKYRTLFEESIDGVYSVLRNGQITDANASFCEIFGYARQEIIGKDIRELYFDTDDRPKVMKEMEKRGFAKDYEITFRKKDGTAIDCLVSASVHFGKDGSIAGYRGILRDLTAYKGLQRQLLQAQKMESIGTLAGGIAHDFNNLLQVVIGYSDMLLFKKSFSDREYEALRTIRQAGKDGADLARRILAVGRRLEPNTRPVNLNHEILRVQKMLGRTLPKMIRIEILLTENVMTVNADAGQMEQALLNLAVNAQHAMPDGGRLTIETANITLDEDYSRTHLDVEPGKYVLLSVSDTGHGMDKEVLEHIFEPFYTTKGPNEGTGLGLAMVFGIVKSHNGHIICYSEPGAGTTFKIYLPAAVQYIEQDVAANRREPTGGTETILLVDDEERIRYFGENLLRMAGYTVLTATNGREALEIYNSNEDRIALVILDLMMPEMGGKQCLEELLKINEKVRVIIASGYSANGTTKDALASGAKGFVGKPYDVRQLLDSIREVLDAE